jgi:hypothetical protein
MIKTYKYKLVPTHKQKTALQQTLDLCRNLYNCALKQRRMHRSGHSRIDLPSTFHKTFDTTIAYVNVATHADNQYNTMIDSNFSTSYGFHRLQKHYLEFLGKPSSCTSTANARGKPGVDGSPRLIPSAECMCPGDQLISIDQRLAAVKLR